MDSLADRIAELSYKHFNSLPKTGKPTDREWTLLSSVVISYKLDKELKLEVVAMGTGSKCLGKNKLSKLGDVINDSHAEIIARRGFLRFVYGELERVYRGNDSIVFNRPDKQFKCRLKQDIQFHLFSSHTPCGDASIFQKSESGFKSEEDGHIKTSRGQKRHISEHSDEEKYGKICKVEEINSDKPINSSSPNNDAEISNLDNNSNLRGKIKIEQDPPIVMETSSLATDSQDKLSNKKDSDPISKDGDPISKDSDLISKDSDPISKDSDPTSKDSDPIFKDSDPISKDSDPISKDSDPISKDSDPISTGCGQDIYRTGAKCVPGGIQDQYGEKRDYHCIGALRIKPGRGDKTICMSCSDKMARWNVVGIQGAMLSHFLLTPIYLSTVTMGKCPYNKEAMKRALVDRIQDVDNLPSDYKQNIPVLLQSSLLFKHSRYKTDLNIDNNLKPSPVAIIWYKDNNVSYHEVSVNGKRQGITSKNTNKPESRCSLCCIEIFRRFHKLKNTIKQDKLPLTLQNISSTDQSTYQECKMAAIEYNEALEKLKEKLFCTWVKKPGDLIQFKLD